MDIRDVLTDAFGRVGRLVDRAVDGLSIEDLRSRPDAEANSIAWLVWHLARVQDAQVSEIAGQAQAYVIEGWADRLGMSPDPADTGYGHTSEQVGAVGPAAETLVQYYRAVERRTLDYLATVDGSDLDRIVDEHWDPPVSAGVRLVSILSDCLQHVGQANYLRGTCERAHSG